MAKQLRQIILIIVIIASVVGLVAILLYSAGYRINFKNGLLEETGALRVVTPNVANLELWLYPSGTYTTSNAANLTHLDPGLYTIVAKATGYSDTTLKLEVHPRETTVIDPLVLWGANEAIPTDEPLIPTKSKDGIKTLAIALQEAIAELPTEDVADVVRISKTEAVVIQRKQGEAKLFRLNGNTVTVKVIAEQISHASYNDNRKLLLNGPYQLGIYALDTDEFTTLLRISNPITAAVWYKTTPYILYSQDANVFSLDTRNNTDYATQLVITTPQPITALQLESDSVLAIEAGNTTYRYAAEVK